MATVYALACVDLSEDEAIRLAILDGWEPLGANDGVMWFKMAAHREPGDTVEVFIGKHRKEWHLTEGEDS